MIKATEAKAKVQQFNEEKAVAVKVRAEQWLEKNADCDIRLLSAKGESTVSYNLSKMSFPEDLLRAICDLLEGAGYEVDCTPIQGANCLTIDW